MLLQITTGALTTLWQRVIPVAIIKHFFLLLFCQLTTRGNRQLLMDTITVRAVIDFETKPKAPLTRMMNERLERFAAELYTYLDLALSGDRNFGDLVVYISYNSNYAVRWTILHQVPERISDLVAQKCAGLGFIAWKNVDLYRFK